VDARMLPLTSRQVLGKLRLLMLIDEKNPNDVLVCLADSVPVTVMFCVLIDLARMLEVTATFISVE